jgi:hypothetical protein
MRAPIQWYVCVHLSGGLGVSAIHNGPLGRGKSSAVCGGHRALRVLAHPCKGIGEARSEVEQVGAGQRQQMGPIVRAQHNMCCARMWPQGPPIGQRQ